MATILVVGDDTSERRRISCLLESIGHDYLEADSGVSALVAAFGREPDLILLDLATRKSEPADTLAFLRKNGVTRAIPVVMLSDKNDMPTVFAGLAQGAADFVKKPVAPNELELVIRHETRTKTPTTLELRWAS